MNSHRLLGGCGKDPEIRATGAGTAIASFTLATSEGRKDAQGIWKDETTWHNPKAFGRMAEIARDQVQKGSKVFVEGKVTTESWDDKQNGQKRYKTVVIANYLSVVPTLRTSEAGKQPSPSVPRSPETLDRYLQSTEISNDDIPF